MKMHWQNWNNHAAFFCTSFISPCVKFCDWLNSEPNFSGCQANLHLAQIVESKFQFTCILLFTRWILFLKWCDIPISSAFTLIHIYMGNLSVSDSSQWRYHHHAILRGMQATVMRRRLMGDKTKDWTPTSILLRSPNNLFLNTTIVKNHQYEVKYQSLIEYKLSIFFYTYFSL